VRDRSRMKADLARILSSMSLVEVTVMLDAIATELQNRDMPIASKVQDASNSIYAYRREVQKQRRAEG
jgi:hypothetical protein